MFNYKFSCRKPNDKVDREAEEALKEYANSKKPEDGKLAILAFDKAQDYWKKSAERATERGTDDYAAYSTQIAEQYGQFRVHLQAEVGVEIEDIKKESDDLSQPKSQLDPSLHWCERCEQTIALGFLKDVEVGLRVKNHGLRDDLTHEAAEREFKFSVLEQAVVIGCTGCKQIHGVRYSSPVAQEYAKRANAASRQ